MNLQWFICSILVGLASSRVFFQEEQNQNQNQNHQQFQVQSQGPPQDQYDQSYQNQQTNSDYIYTAQVPSAEDGNYPQQMHHIQAQEQIQPQSDVNYYYPDHQQQQLPQPQPQPQPQQYHQQQQQPQPQQYHQQQVYQQNEPDQYHQYQQQDQYEAQNPQNQNQNQNLPQISYQQSQMQGQKQKVTIPQLLSSQNLSPEQREVLTDLMTLASQEDSQTQGRSFGFVAQKFNSLWSKFLQLFPGLYLDFDPYTNSLYETVPFLKRVQTPIVYKENEYYPDQTYNYHHKFPIIGGIMNFFGGIKKKIWHKKSFTALKHHPGSDAGQYGPHAQVHRRGKRSIDDNSQNLDNNLTVKSDSEPSSGRQGRTLSVVNSFFQRILSPFTGSRPNVQPGQPDYQNSQFLDNGFVQKTGISPPNIQPGEDQRRPSVHFTTVMQQLPEFMNRILHRVQNTNLNTQLNNGEVENPISNLFRRIFPRPNHY